MSILLLSATNFNIKLGIKKTKNKNNQKISQNENEKENKIQIERFEEIGHVLVEKSKIELEIIFGG